MATNRHILCRSGFTFVELMLGLLITSMIAGALASLSFAVGQQWQSTDGAQSLQVISRQATLRIEKYLRPAKYVGYVVSDHADSSRDTNHDGKLDTVSTGAAVFFWKADANSDGTMQLAEIALLEHDGFSGNLTLYTAESVSPNGACFGTDIDSSADVASFKKVAAGHVLVPDVSSVSFALQNSTDPTRRPSLEYTFTFARSGQQCVRYGTATLRGPTTTPVAQ